MASEKTNIIGKTTSDDIRIIVLPDGYSMVTYLSFKFPRKKSPKIFQQTVSELNTYISEVRNKCLEKIAQEYKIKISWQE